MNKLRGHTDDLKALPDNVKRERTARMIEKVHAGVEAEGADQMLLTQTARSALLISLLQMSGAAHAL